MRRNSADPTRANLGKERLFKYDMGKKYRGSEKVDLTGGVGGGGSHEDPAPSPDGLSLRLGFVLNNILFTVAYSPVMFSTVQYTLAVFWFIAKTSHRRNL